MKPAKLMIMRSKKLRTLTHFEQMDATQYGDLPKDHLEAIHQIADALACADPWEGEWTFLKIRPRHAARAIWREVVKERLCRIVTAILILSREWEKAGRSGNGSFFESLGLYAERSRSPVARDWNSAATLAWLDHMDGKASSVEELMKLLKVDSKYAKRLFSYIGVPTYPLKRGGARKKTNRHLRGATAL